MFFKDLIQLCTWINIETQDYKVMSFVFQFAVLIAFFIMLMVAIASKEPSIAVLCFFILAIDFIIILGRAAADQLNKENDDV